VQTCTVPCSLFSFSYSPLAILLQQIFSLQQSFLQQFPFSQKPPIKKLLPSKSLPSSKSLVSFFSESFISSGKQGGGETVLGEGHDIVTRGKAAELHLAFSLSSVAVAVLNISQQIIWHKHLRKSSCSAAYSSLLLWLGLCQSQPTEYWVQLCLCPHRLLLLCNPTDREYENSSEYDSSKDQQSHSKGSGW
jgi:hypothetical protein